MFLCGFSVGRGLGALFSSNGGVGLRHQLSFAFKSFSGPGWFSSGCTIKCKKFCSSPERLRSARVLRGRWVQVVIAPLRNCTIANLFNIQAKRTHQTLQNLRKPPFCEMKYR